MKTQERIYLNNAATSYPKPPAVHIAVRRAMEQIPCHTARAGFETGGEDVFTLCREKLARLLHAPRVEDILLTSGATESLNLVLRGFDFSNGHIVTTTTEHNSVLRPLTHLQEENDVTVTYVDCDSDGTVDPASIQQAMRDDTRAVVVNHCSNVTGTVQDLAAITEATKALNTLMIVDASQSLGNLPIDVVDMGIDVLVFTGHKSLYGMAGTGGFYLREGLEPRPLKVGGTGIRSDLLIQPPERPLYYEVGTQNHLGFAALCAGLEFIENETVSAIGQYKHHLCRRLVASLESISGIRIHGPAQHGESTMLVSLNVVDLDPADAGYMLAESFGITVRAGLHCAPLIHKALGTYPRGSLRISPSYFTAEEQIDKLVQALEQMCVVGIPL